MLADLRRKRERLTAATFHWPAPSRGPTASRLSPGKLVHCHPFESTGGAARRFFATVDRIAEHFRHSGGATEEMNLETMGLFFCTHLCIDAANIFFGLRIRPAAHNDQNKLNKARVNDCAESIRLPLYPVWAGAKDAIFPYTPLRPEARNKDTCLPATRRLIEQDHLRPWLYTRTLPG